MERHIVGFFILLITFAIGVSLVNPRLVFLDAEKEWQCCFSIVDVPKPE